MEKENEIEKDQRESFKKMKEMDEDIFGSITIKPTSFYSNKDEKTKLNWFCYELAIGIYNELTKNFKEELKKYKIDDKEIMEFFSLYLQDNEGNCLAETF
jgi:hypothetical protein